ncbi:MAG: glycosyltransferase family 39 protein [Ignavibacteria bacterium]
MNEEKDLRSNHITSDPDSKFTFFKSNFLYSPYFHYILPVLYFLIILFVSLTNRAIGDYGVESDFYSGYAPQAKELLSGNLVIDPFKGPLYSIILSIVGFICGEDFYFAGKIINIFSSAIALIFVSKLISTLLNRESAFFGTLIIAVNYTFLTFTYTPDTDMLFFLFYISALYFILKPDFVEFNKFVFIAGVLTSFAYLTRYTAISLIIFVSMFFLVRVYKWFRIRKNIPPPIFSPIIYYFIPVIIIIIAWGTISYKKTGHFFYNQNYENTSYTLYKPEGMSKEEWNDKYRR